jgi:pimeloyl-ACP methyl ester carboxylesterase
MDRSVGLAKVAHRLDHRCHVVRYDRRGYGRSRPHPGPFGLSEQVDDLVAVLDGRPAVLVGHSFGGDVVLAAAERHPDLVLGAVVYEPPLSWETWWPGTTAGASAVATAGDPGDAAERFLRRMLGDDRWERLRPATQAARRAEGPALVGELTDLRRRPAWTGAGVRAPVVAGFGGQARPHHRRAAEVVVERIPGSVAVELPGAGHLAPRTHPDDFVGLLVEPILARSGAEG